MVAYLIKPPNKFTLQSTIDLVLLKKGEEEMPAQPYSNSQLPINESIFVKRNKIFHKILIEDIQYVEASGNYSVIYVDKNKFVSNLTFRYIDSLLPKELFVHVHRSFILNTRYLSNINIENNEIVMENGNTLPISRSKKQAFLKRINIG